VASRHRPGPSRCSLLSLCPKWAALSFEHPRGVSTHGYNVFLSIFCSYNLGSDKIRCLYSTGLWAEGPLSKVWVFSEGMCIWMYLHWNGEFTHVGPGTREPLTCLKTYMLVLHVLVLHILNMTVRFTPSIGHVTRSWMWRWVLCMDTMPKRTCVYVVHLYSIKIVSRCLTTNLCLSHCPRRHSSQENALYHLSWL
jgi:hypothetical protein